MLESVDEQRYVQWCKENNLLCEKVKFQQAGYPDRLVIGNGLHIWIEFKQRKKKPGPLQLYRIAMLRERGALAGWTDDSTIAICATYAIMAAARLPEASHTVATLAEQWGLVFGPRARQDEYVFGSPQNLAGQRLCLEMFNRGPPEANVQGLA